MRHPLLFAAFLAVVLSIGSASWAAHTTAMNATPETSHDRGTLDLLALVERNDHTTTVDLGAAGPSAGDLRVWGPNPLYDADNVSDTGATTQGTCVALDASFACVLTETIVFPDGSTLEMQGVEQGGATSSTRTIVGGSGRYLGATGTVAVAPSDDFTLWTRKFEITDQ